ncbi:MAG: S41 family peptidase [Candidatus Beckwithbacteria bacterium]|nr:S41 family peptidase [Patescibacteria group bacterium]
MKISLKQIRTGVLILSLVLMAGVIGYRIGKKEISVSNLGVIKLDRSQPDDKNSVDLRMFWQVWDKLGESYLIKESLKPTEMVWGAIRGMTASLEDPYTVFLPPKQNKATNEELNGAFEGVGIQLGFIDGQLGVIAPLAGMPAEATGVKAGDLILHIKDEAKDIDVDTTDMSLPEAVEIIRGPKDSLIDLTLFHAGDSDLSIVTIKRETIVIKSVELFWKGENLDIAYIKLSRFGGRTEEEWNNVVDEVVAKKNARGIILDLRNNPGGYLQGAVIYAGEFLDRGLIVVKQEDSKGKVETYSVNDKGRLLDKPLVVLINKGSASSSEILSGALRDHQRAKLIGEKSFGKGTIQEALELGKGAGLHVTTAKWLLPSGQWVNETKGITPDIEIEDDLETVDIDEQFIKALEVVYN